jgi:hypothetical protein
MGAIGNAMAAYAQPLIDQTNGSSKQIQIAMTFAMLCWNMAILPDREHEDFLAGIRPTLKMSDEEFAEFRRDIVEPMIRRHREMFPKHSLSRPQMLSNGGPSR